MSPWRGGLLCGQVPCWRVIQLHPTDTVSLLEESNTAHGTLIDTHHLDLSAFIQIGLYQIFQIVLFRLHQESRQLRSCQRGQLMPTLLGCQ